MKKFKFLVLTVVAALALSSCGTTQTVPLTGRTHRISVSDERATRKARSVRTSSTPCAASR